MEAGIRFARAEGYWWRVSAAAFARERRPDFRPDGAWCEIVGRDQGLRHLAIDCHGVAVEECVTSVTSTAPRWRVGLVLVHRVARLNGEL